MYAIIVSLAICGVILFILFLRKIHTSENSKEHHVSKLYVDNSVIEFEGEQIRSNGKVDSQIPPGHFEELIESLNRCSRYKEIYGNYKEYVAINNILKIGLLTRFVRQESFARTEPTNYRADLKYGGCYFETTDGVAMVYAIGDTSAILEMCSQIHDKEEILRIAQKWAKQNYLVTAIATADVYGDKKNVLTRGVKEKMTFLGLLAIPN